MLKPLILALQLLTRIHVPIEIGVTDAQIGRSMLFYPVVGLLLGGIIYAVALVLPEQSLLLNAALLTTLWIGLTGALHIDGLADSADAWVGGMGDPQRTLEIMKDPYCGPMGVTVILVTVILKFAALYTLLQQGYLLPLLLIPMMGRAQILLLFLTTPYVRKQGMGSALADHLPRTPAWLVLLTSTLVWSYFMQGSGMLTLVFLLVMFVIFRQGLMRRINGTTGDTAGALVELSELVLLIGAAVW
ncbi:MAG: adenosylcobinamide-GDP ribazoletransferase [Gammaproteobacteria bacterium]|nr:adenosylcobinamide-GDP ribazoletransferase [Gammaproteobacteria bacterium]